MKSLKLILLAGVAIAAAGPQSPAYAQGNPLDILGMSADAIAQLDPAFRLEMARQAVTAAQAELERVRAAGGDVAAAEAQLTAAQTALTEAEAAAAAPPAPPAPAEPAAPPAAEPPPVEPPAEPPPPAPEPPPPPVQEPPPPPAEPPAPPVEPPPPPEPVVPPVAPPPPPAPDQPPAPPVEPPPAPPAQPNLLDVLPPAIGDVLRPAEPPAPAQEPPAPAPEPPAPPAAAEPPPPAPEPPVPAPEPPVPPAAAEPPAPAEPAPPPPAEPAPLAPEAAPPAPAAEAPPPAAPADINPQILDGPAGELLERLFGGQPPPPPPPPPPPLPAAEAVPVPEAAVGEQVIQQVDNRIIIQLDNNQFAVRNTDQDRFRYQGETLDTQTLPNGNVVATSTRVDGTKIITLYDTQGNILRRVRQDPDGSEVLLIGLPPDLDRDQDGILDNPPPAYAEAPPVGGPVYNYDTYLPPLVVPIPQEQYIVDLQYATPEAVEQAIFAPPVEQVERPYTLEEIRFNERIRDKVVRIDLDTITFATGSADVAIDQIDDLEYIGYYMAEAIQRNPAEVFLVEGHTDAVGSNASNLLLSDRRAESVAIILTQYMGIPPENLVTQGYGEEYLKVPTEAAERLNRRVTIRNISELLGGGQVASAVPPPPPPPPPPTP